MNGMKKSICVILEQREGIIKESSLAMASTIAELSRGNNLSMYAIVIGGNQIINRDEIGKFGIENIIHAGNPSLIDYSPTLYADILASLIDPKTVSCIIISHTAFGQDIGPRLAGTMHTQILTDCVEVSFDNDVFRATKTIFGGKVNEIADISSVLHIITLRPNLFKKIEFPVESQIKALDFVIPDNNSEITTIEFGMQKKDVTEADIIISGGRGMQSAENFSLIRDLAYQLQGAVGASRAVVDAGWISHESQIGQTGKTVSPSLYIACGISGSIQHLAGMSSSKCIVAFNTDKNAPIFSVADYGIVGDVLQILPKFATEIKK